MGILAIATTRQMPVASDPELFIRLGHHGGIISLAWSADGRMLASGGADGSIRIWDAASGELQRIIHAHSSGVNALAWQPGKSTLASAGGDAAIQFWDPESGAARRSISTTAVHSLLWSPDGKKLAGVNSKMEEITKVQVWDAATGTVLQTFHDEGNSMEFAQSLAWSPDSEKLLIFGNDTKMFRIDSGAPVRDFGSVAVPGNQALAWNSASDSFIQAYELHPLDRAGTELRRVRSEDGSVLWSAPSTDHAALLAWSPDGRILADAGVEKLEFHDAASGAVLKTIAASVQAIAWSPDSHTLASGCLDGTLQIWRADDGTPMRTIAPNLSSVAAVAWSPDGATLASGGSDHDVKLWEVRSGTLVRSLAGHSRRVLGLAWNRGGKILASVSSDQTIRLWDGATFSLLHTLPVSANPNGDLPYDEPDRRPPPMAWSPDGRLLAVSEGGLADTEVRLWNAITGKLERAIHNGSGIYSLAWSPDGKTVAVGQDGGVKLWRADGTDSAEAVASLYTGVPVGMVTYRPDGKILVADTMGTDVDPQLLETWQVDPVPVPDAQPQCIGPDPLLVDTAQWGPDGRTLALATGSLSTWNPETCTQIRVFSGADGGVRSVTWSPDGNLLATAGFDGSFSTWQAASGAVQWTIHMLPNGQSIAVSPKNLFYSASPGGESYTAIRYGAQSSLLMPLEAFRRLLRRPNLAGVAAEPRPVIRPDWQYVAAEILHRHPGWLAVAALVYLAELVLTIVSSR